MPRPFSDDDERSEESTVTRRSPKANVTTREWLTLLTVHVLADSDARESDNPEARARALSTRAVLRGLVARG